MLSDDNDSYSTVAAAELGLGYQLCILHMCARGRNQEGQVHLRAGRKRGDEENKKLGKQYQAKEASAAYRMRMLTLELWNDWNKIRLHLARPMFGLDGTNNATERGISKSKLRYKTMRGYKCPEGMENGIA